MLSSRRSKAAVGLHRAPVSLPIAVRDRDRLLATPARVLLFDLLGATQSFLPGPLQRARHQTVLRLYRIILARCAFCVVTSVLALERPLPLHCARFLLNLV